MRIFGRHELCNIGTFYHNDQKYKKEQTTITKEKVVVCSGIKSSASYSSFNTRFQYENITNN
jgi:hypothetical protein